MLASENPTKIPISNVINVHIFEYVNTKKIQKQKTIKC